jgi:hypothetical protein
LNFLEVNNNGYVLPVLAIAFYFIDGWAGIRSNFHFKIEELIYELKISILLLS